VAQITTVTSESLQAEVRRLLPSQQGFGEDLQASNVITPIIDLTSVASGTNVPQYQAQAINLVGITVFSIGSATTTIINTAGFWKVSGYLNNSNSSAPDFSITDGTTTKKFYDLLGLATTNADTRKVFVDFNVFLRSGDSVTCQNGSATIPAVLYVQQLADVNGNTTLPTGFTPE
jgi:hypothetical protein